MEKDPKKTPKVLRVMNRTAMVVGYLTLIPLVLILICPKSSSATEAVAETVVDRVARDIDTAIKECGEDVFKEWLEINNLVESEATRKAFASAVDWSIK